MVKHTPLGDTYCIILYILICSDWVAHGGVMVKRTSLGSGYSMVLYVIICNDCMPMAV